MATVGIRAFWLGTSCSLVPVCRLQGVFIVWPPAVTAISSQVDSLKCDLRFAIIRVAKLHVCMHE